jgi:hypothetical protein
MELHEFITKVLGDISLGIKNANKLVDGQPFTIERYQRDNERGYISFDVGVTTSNKSEKSGGAGIQVQVLNIGGKSGKQESQENYNRIKFFIIPERDIK